MTLSELYMYFYLVKFMMIKIYVLWLAALHFNENTQRDQAVTQDGKARYRRTAPKYKKGEFIVRKINVDCTYGK